MTLATIGLVGLYFVSPSTAHDTFQGLWWVALAAYGFVTTTTLLLDRDSARRSWVEGLLFPGAGALLVMLSAAHPGLLTHTVPGWFGLELTSTGLRVLTLALYSWSVIAMLLAFLVRSVETLPGGRWLSRVGLYVVGFGPVLCAITLDAYVKQWRGQAAVWDKTEKTGRVMG